jgi:acyl-CoA thioesterase-1
MKIYKKLPYVLLFLFTLHAKARAQTYSIFATPTNVIVGEKVRVQWTSPLLTFDVFNWVGWFAIDASDRDYIEKRFTVFRFGDTDYDMNVAGTFNFRLFNSAGRQVAVSETVRVLPLVADPYAVRNYPSGNRNIIAFGDSLVQGFGVAPLDSMVAELSRLIKAPIRNAGVAGDTTERALKRLDTDVLVHDPQVVIVLLGGNDILQGVRATNTLDNVRTIVSRIQESGAVVILCGVQGGVFTDALADGFRSIASEMRAAYVPNIVRGIIGNPFLSSDAVHPNAEGYRIMAERILPALQKLYAPKPELRVSLARSGAGLELRWTMISNRIYRVLGNATVGGTNWQTFATIRGGGGMTNYFYAPSLPALFFRIEETR